MSDKSRSAGPPGQIPGHLEPTMPRLLLIAALFGALGGWLVSAGADALGEVAPNVPWTAPIGIALLAAIVGALAYTTHQQIQVRKLRIESSRAVAFLVLGKASALGGALIAGGYLAYALRFIGQLSVEGPRDRVIGSAVSVLAGIALCAMGLLLERACKVPESDGDENDRKELGDA